MHPDRLLIRALIIADSIKPTHTNIRKDGWYPINTEYERLPEFTHYKYISDGIRLYSFNYTFSTYGTGTLIREFRGIPGRCGNLMYFVTEEDAVGDALVIPTELREMWSCRVAVKEGATTKGSRQ